MQHQTSHDPSEPITSQHQVWELVSKQLRNVRAALQKSNNALYDHNQDRIAHLAKVQTALQELTAGRKSSIDSFRELEKLLEQNFTKSKEHKEAAGLLQSFHDNCSEVFDQLQQIRSTVTDEILYYLKVFCSDYHKLGIADDAFYDSLQSRTEVVDNYTERFDELSEVISIGSAIPQDLLGYSYFSQELAIELDCHNFPVLRVIPDLIQKLEMACDIAAEWLRNDKVYVQELEQEINEYNDKIHDLEITSKSRKLKYERLFAELKQKQSQLDLEHIADLKAEINQLQSKLNVISHRLKRVDSSKSLQLKRTDSSKMLQIRRQGSNKSFQLQKTDSKYFPRSDSKHFQLARTDSKHFQLPRTDSKHFQLARTDSKHFQLARRDSQQFQLARTETKIFELRRTGSNRGFELKKPEGSSSVYHLPVIEVADCCASEDEEDGRLSSSSTRLRTNTARQSPTSQPAQKQQENLQHNLQQQHTSISADIEEKQQELASLEWLEAVVLQLSTKLRSTGRYKVQLTDELRSCKAQVERLSAKLKEKMCPEVTVTLLPKRKEKKRKRNKRRQALGKF